MERYRRVFARQSIPQRRNATIDDDDDDDIPRREREIAVAAEYKLIC